MNSFLHFLRGHELMVGVVAVAIAAIVVGVGMVIIWRALGEARDGEETEDGLRLKS